ncbi:MAG: hypothetical protein OH319_00085 [Candidatus Parvarchaeota archaeon]|nr:hypothetical protein [Candidatus Jingweiarchaeum tengchongense]MCW1298454.1 hypothetical protein [Candidatus Jingweiarchaeum tengchongense]MCW1300546.1 hypothetical protein [Candidatus Jingweiarchaeum tengchongense]MCW1304979.1 hypothetical protein [Candidatus Jingweiarchaeum tengchongense]MCW1309296.1 hypothetical protein [Candidatus Jingweiarchaeum tengchongense]
MQNKAYAVTPIIFILLFLLAFLFSSHYTEINEILSKQVVIESNIFMTNVKLQKERLNKDNFLTYCCYRACQIALNWDEIEIFVNECMRNKFNFDFQIKLIDKNDENFSVSFIFPAESFSLTNVEANFSEKNQTKVIDYPFIKLKNAAEKFNESEFSNCISTEGCDCVALQECLNETQDPSFYWLFKNETDNCTSGMIFVYLPGKEITRFFPRFVRSLTCGL